MTKPSVHAILGELHKLLSAYGKGDFIEASKYVGVSRAMRHALRALALEAEPGVEIGPRRGRSGATPSNSRSRATAPTSERAQILNLIRRSPLFATTHSILKYAERLGLHLSMNSKTSRERLAGKLVSLIESLPESRKSEVITDLLKGRNSQTQGWIDVIKER